MSVNKPQGPSANEYDPLALLGITDPKREAKASDLDKLAGGPTKSSEELPSFSELGKKGVAFGKPAESGASGQIAAQSGVGVTTVTKFNDNKAALSHGGLLGMSKTEPNRVQWTGRLPDQPRTGQTFDNRKVFAHTSLRRNPNTGPSGSVPQPLTLGAKELAGGERPKPEANMRMGALLSFSGHKFDGILSGADIVGPDGKPIPFKDI